MNYDRVLPQRDKLLGLKQGQNAIVAPHPAWTGAFYDERRRLQPALERLTNRIEHFGSTSVRDLRAKPIIDILVGLDALEQWILLIEPLHRLGYVYFADAGVPAHHVFSRHDADGDRTHLLHAVRFRSPQWTRNLGFRDWLRVDPALRLRYQAEKEAAAAQAPSDRLAYNACKSRFIQGVMARLTT